ncbi:hypothetical protein [Moorena sp. SIO3H5]|uniref:hypothetical protein n=1 Tax=Moorena sp. SIO3H5 TaxID=2607834 RepID=UPI0025E00D9D|nr:hypothetical protein [Moorena sp. SIO3H5]
MSTLFRYYLTRSSVCRTHEVHIIFYLFPIPFSLLPAPCSLLPKNQKFVPHKL